MAKSPFLVQGKANVVGSCVARPKKKVEGYTMADWIPKEDFEKTEYSKLDLWHFVRRGTIGEAGAHSREEHAHGDDRSKAGFCPWTPLPAARQGSAGTAGPRFCEATKSHLGARLLLASSLAMFYRAISEMQAGLLEPET